MRMLNKVMLIGRVGRDVELRRVGAEGPPWAVLSVATSRYRKDGEHWIEAADWHQVKVFGREAEYAQRAVRKGSLVSVEGSLTYDRWTSEDGTRHHATRIIADRLATLSTPERAVSESSATPMMEVVDSPEVVIEA
jgi:single-strand DNA-binding protein